MKTSDWIFVIAIELTSLAYTAFVLMVLWSWFIVPTFELTALSIWQAAGVALIVSLVTHQANTADLSKTALHEFVHPTIILVFGFLVHVFM